MKIIFTPIEDFNDKRALYVKTKNVEGVELMNCDINKITINRGGSYI